MFPHTLKRLRQIRGITQAELAKVCGVSQQAVGMWERGRNMPNNDTLNKLAIYFNVSLDDLAMPKLEKGLLNGLEETAKSIEEKEQDRRNEAARAFLNIMLQGNPKAQAIIAKATVTAKGDIDLPGLDVADQKYINRMRAAFIEALEDATKNGEGLNEVILSPEPTK